MPPVIDTNVILHGRANYSFDRALTVPGVMEELESSGGKLRADQIDLDVITPSDRSLEKIREKADEIEADVSETDMEVLALAMDRGGKLLTDDLELQNLALHLGIDFDGHLEDRIEEKREWKTVCGNCGKDISETPCPRCGSDDLHRKLCSRSSV
ncbi:MAG: NOB1 family endonuclease [Candidatus Nanohaloarchaea archaeon]